MLPLRICVSKDKQGSIEEIWEGETVGMRLCECECLVVCGLIVGVEGHQ